MWARGGKNTSDSAASLGVLYRPMFAMAAMMSSTHIGCSGVSLAAACLAFSLAKPEFGCSPTSIEVTFKRHCLASHCYGTPFDAWTLCGLYGPDVKPNLQSRKTSCGLFLVHHVILMEQDIIGLAQAAELNSRRLKRDSASRRTAAAARSADA
eukprot:6189227-Pleurochrysis_carterae.AAC.1